MEDADKEAIFKGERDYKKCHERGVFSQCFDSDYNPPKGYEIAYIEGRKRAEEARKKSW